MATDTSRKYTFASELSLKGSVANNDTVDEQDISEVEESHTHNQNSEERVNT